VTGASLRQVSPQPRGVIPADEAKRLDRAGRAKERADSALRAAVVAALEAGGSVREVAALARVSTNTVARWKRDPTGRATPD
jgi:DNA invertase Pin-like site-specific DNA recombinase